MITCLFCNKPIEGKTPIEHIWPESFGGKSLIATDGSVCKSCNNYFSREVERLALESFPFKYIRSFFGIATKKNKVSVSTTPIGEMFGQPGGRFVYLNSKEHNEKAKTGEIDTVQFKVSLKCEHPSSVCRLLLKMAIEWIAIDNITEAYSEKYNSAKQFVRSPKKGSQWSFAIDFKNEILFESHMNGISSGTDFNASMSLEGSEEISFFIVKILGLKLITPLMKNILFSDISRPDFHIYKVEI